MTTPLAWAAQPEKQPEKQLGKQNNPMFTIRKVERAGTIQQHQAMFSIKERRKTSVS